MVSNKCKNSSLSSKNHAELAPIPSRIMKRRSVESSQNRDIRDNVEDQNAILRPCRSLSNPSYPLKKIDEEWEGSKKYADWISSLPDDVLIQVLSSLDLKEAARTSVLSKRWRHVWAKLPDIYDFSFCGRALMISLYGPIHYIGLDKFLDWVNQVLSSTRARKNIDRFRVKCALDNSYSYQLQSWVDFAMGRCVKELDLSMSCAVSTILYIPVYLCPFGRFAQSPGAQTLVSVSLTGIRISSDFVASILSNLPNLECLKLRNCPCAPEIFYIGIAGSSLKLTRLEISLYDGLEGIVIYAGNLKSFVLGGVCEGDIKVIYAPQLDEVSVSAKYVARVINYFPCFFSQLTKLNLLYCQYQNILGIVDGAIQFPLFPRLKQLELDMAYCPNQRLIVLTDLIDACPVLHKFKLKHMRWLSRAGEMPRRSRVLRRLHHHLREFEMVDFLGYEVEIEFVMYLLQFAPLLDKIILRPTDGFFGYTKQDQLQARVQAELLGLRLAGRVQLEIL